MPRKLKECLHQYLSCPQSSYTVEKISRYLCFSNFSIIFLTWFQFLSRRLYTTVIGSYYTCLYAYCTYTILLLLTATTHVYTHTVYYTTVIGSYYTCLYAYCILNYSYWELRHMCIRTLNTILLLFHLFPVFVLFHCLLSSSMPFHWYTKQ